MVENLLFNTWHSLTAVILTKDVSLFYHKHGNKKNSESHMWDSIHKNLYVGEVEVLVLRSIKYTFLLALKPLE